MTTKTPVSMLQEMMTRMGAPPKYDLIYDGSGTHTAVFKYRVFANNVTAIGSGRSKKEAKHDAARVALEKLKSYQIEDSQPSGIPPDPIEILTPYKDKFEENAIGALHDMCTLHDIPMPEYELIEELGAPHEKIFTFVCSVSKQKEIGVARTKKQAKQLAANKMMNRLKESLGDVLKDIETEQVDEPLSDNFQRVIGKYVAATGTPSKKLRLNRNPNKYHNFFCETAEECQDAARDMLQNINLPPSAVGIENLDTNWMELLLKVLNCFDVQHSLKPGTVLNNGAICVFLRINFSSEATFYGSGADCERAVQEAAYNALGFIKIHLRQVGSST